jgi:transmembrane sensor
MRTLFAGLAGWRLPSNAAEWVARLQSHPLTPRESDAFKAWLLEDPLHREEYERCDRVGRLASHMRARADLVHALPAYASLGEAPRKARSPSFVVPALAAAIVLGFVFVLIAHSPTPSSTGSYRTAHGEVREIVLPDGSLVNLNTDSALQVAFSGEERRVILARGEAYFQVEKEPGGRPFVVYSRGTQVRVVGTKFNVRALEHGTDVIVSEGLVEVLPDPSRLSPSIPAKVELRPGNSLRIDSVRQKVSIAAGNPQRATAWRSGMIDFDNATMEEMIAEVNRYTAVPFAIADDNIRAVRLSGTFRIGDAESVRFALQDGFGVEATSRGDRVELHGPR